MNFITLVLKCSKKDLFYFFGKFEARVSEVRLGYSLSVTCEYKAITYTNISVSC